MSIQYILGNSGSGKTEFLYQKILEEAKRYPSQTYYVVVPEQFTMQTQREFVMRSPNKCIMNIDVVSFDRLAYRIFDELGLTQIQVLDDIGKSLLLRRIIQNKKKDLKIFKNNVEKPGYIDQIKSLISELEQYQVSPDALVEIVSRRQDDVLKFKLDDILLIYQEFLSFTQKKYITNEELLGVFADEIKHSIKLKQAVFAFDGYTGFTPVQASVIKELMKISSKIWITVLLDRREDYSSMGEKHSLFFMSKKFIHQLNKLAEETKILLEDPIVLSNQNNRFLTSPGLAFLEQNLFRSKQEKFLAKQKQIEIMEFSDPKDEMEFVAREIVEQVRTKKMRYRSFAIVTGDVSTYGELAADIFENLAIPYYIDEKKKLSYSTGMEYIKGLLGILTTSYDFDSVFRFLKTGLTGFDRELIDKVENFCLKYRIQSRKKWKKNWDLAYSKEEDCAILEEFRIDFYFMIESLADKIGKKGETVRDKTQLLYEFLVEFSLEKRLDEMAKVFCDEKDFVREKEYSQSFRKIIEVFDHVVELLGDEIISMEDYSQILEAAFDTIKVGTIPTSNDYVLVGDIQRTRFEGIHTLFFVGVNEGIIPQTSVGSICLNQTEREKLEDENLVLAPSAKERTFMQQFYLYMVLTKPSTKLFLSYALVGLGGTSMTPSYLIRQIRKIIPSLLVTTDKEELSIDKWYTPKQAFGLLAMNLGENEQDYPPYLGDLLNWFLSETDWSSKAKKLIKTKEFKHISEFINTDLTNKLYGDILVNSVSRLETYEKCACMHFLQYGLGLKERQLGEFDAMDMGNALHESLQRYGEFVKQMNMNWNEYSEKEQEKVIDEIVLKTLESMNVEFLEENARKAYEIKRLKRLVKRTVQTIGIETDQSNYQPTYFETTFEEVEKGEEKLISLDHSGAMELIGKIDRIDLRKMADALDFRVVDYKSSSKKLDFSSVYYGLQLQLAVYVNMAEKLLKKEFPGKKILPEGAYYYRIDDPLIKVTGELTQEEINVEIAKELQMNGEDGIEHLNMIKEYAKHKVKQVGNKIKSGNIDTNPFHHGTESGCDYCKFQAICKFDEKTEGYSFNQMRKLDVDEAIAKMKEE